MPVKNQKKDLFIIQINTGYFIKFLIKIPDE